MEIKYDSYLDSLQDDDIIEQPQVIEQTYDHRRNDKYRNEVVYRGALFKAQDVKQKISGVFTSLIPYQFSCRLDVNNKEVNGYFYKPDKLFGEGLQCRILRSNSEGWKSGKIKVNVNISIEFIPDEPEITEPESPLDEIRREISRLQQ
ncbi:KGK domain-containing protein [Synechocystis sp. LKSZ1]|uniref:KGK domain-containing protein n=1 Tax=Synechocystis sp. LKSZ1 TaxID=3144951 RepID=UPI00336C0201